MFREPIFDKIKLPAIAAILTLLLSLTAFAGAIDPEQTGNIEVTLKSEETGQAILGGSLTLYQVGKVAVDDWNYSFELTDEFAESGFSLDDLKPDGNPELAKKFADYVSDHSLPGKTVPVDDRGSAVFTKLENGLYLIVQTEASVGYYPVNPFLVGIPRYNDDTETYEYDIDATPKTEPAQKETQPETEPEPEETKPSETSPHSGGGGGGGSSSGPRSTGVSSGGPGEGEAEIGTQVWDLLPLPQTGQGWAMLAAVVVMIAAGIAALVTLYIKSKG